jgi:acetyltransferase-like isoleucine patch superfamily enzyme
MHGKLHIGHRTIFGHHCTLAARDSLIIGDDCLIAEMVSIRDHDHCFDRLDVPIREQGAVSAPIKIGRNVWLGAKVTVVKGITIGDNAIVGANAVVTKDIPANAICCWHSGACDSHETSRRARHDANACASSNANATDVALAWDI